MKCFIQRVKYIAI